MHCCNQNFLLAVFVLTFAVAAGGQEIEPRPADPAPLADESLILDVVRAGERYIAVGERGHVVISREGRDWEQAESVPVSATLTRVAFAGGRLWAVGHDTTIISSRDLGQTWQLQHFDPPAERPLLDVHFLNANEGLAIGAYGLIMRTEDGGENWDSMDMVDQVTSEAIEWSEAAEEADQHADTEMGMEEVDPEDELYDAEEDFDRGCYEFRECHLNAITEVGSGELMIAAEQGYGYRSTDGGQSWESFRFPYPGSMFGLLPVHNGVLAFGLRGHVQFTQDFGDTWELLDSGIQSTLMGGVVDSEGRAIMVGAGASVVTWDPRSGTFNVREDRLGSDYAAVLQADDGSLILAGEEGLEHE